jgi:hypothetical protein
MAEQQEWVSTMYCTRKQHKRGDKLVISVIVYTLSNLQLPPGRRHEREKVSCVALRDEQGAVKFPQLFPREQWETQAGSGVCGMLRLVCAPIELSGDWFERLGFCSVYV